MLAQNATEKLILKSPSSYFVPEHFLSKFGRQLIYNGWATNEKTGGFQAVYRWEI